MNIDGKRRWQETDASRNSSTGKESLYELARQRIDECMAFDERAKEYEIFFLEFRFIIEDQDIADLYDLKQCTIYLRMIDGIKLHIRSMRTAVLSALKRIRIDLGTLEAECADAELRRRIAVETSLIESYDHVMDVLVGDVEYFSE